MATFPSLAYVANTTAELDDEGNELIEARMLADVTVSASGYLPFKDEIIFSQFDRLGEVRLVPRQTGFTTPEISAASGGKFLLPKLGTLVVASNALLADARLRIVPIPMESTSPSLLNGTLRQQFWLEAVGPNGQSLSNVIAPNSEGISLSSVLPFTETEPANDTGSWYARNFDAAFVLKKTTEAVFDAEDNQITMILGEGNNLLERAYATSVGEGCVAGAWKLESRHVSTEVTITANAAILCGLYLNSISASVSKGESVETTAELSAEVAVELGWEGKALFGKVSGKLGVKVTGSISGTTAKTTLAEGKAESPSTGTINGAAQPLAPPYSCISGNAHVGMVYKTYRLFAFRRKVCENGTIERQIKVLGTLQVAQGVSLWFSDLVWDNTCPGCPTSGTIPSFPQNPAQGN